MKILLISNMYPSEEKPYAGIFIKNQYERLKTIMLNDEIHLFYMKRKYTNTLSSILKYANTFIKFIPNLFKKYDIIHVHFFYPLIILAILYKKLHRKTKIVVTFHGTDITQHVQSRINKKIYSVFAAQVDIIIAVGRDLAEEIENKLRVKVNVILSAGIDENTFYKEEQTNKEFDYLFVGSFISRKGTDILIESIKQITNTNIKYCFVGSGEFIGELQKLNKEQVKIYQNLNQQQLRTIYNKSRFFVLPSRNEPFGLVVTESMFCGTPAIVAPNGGLTEQVIDNKNGYIMKENTPEVLSEIINKTIAMNEDEYKNISENAYRSNKTHSLNNICMELKEIYKNIYVK
ncbi:MAG: glycosyltransferase family 4 protein [Sporocytophaga sp.]|uniref:glycosyltransferase family 4 protein n=1 Tax=Sporocytophaga sp. TaxID=2231183 RepID=UPI001B2DF679|nr:glycosyltransferase family 4 protein [Sporocytophaga sp.]MBO9699280.1 glycosyltransferase family 4 protein [Sporocytophaga sp.]